MIKITSDYCEQFEDGTDFTWVAIKNSLRQNERSFEGWRCNQVIRSMDILADNQRHQLAAMAEAADRSAEWPTASWEVLRTIGACGWLIPSEYGGLGWDAVAILRGMEQIASCCLTTAFAFSQREAAIRHLLRGPEHLKRRYLPKLASGDWFATVGLSQLTTSRQHLGPALRATRHPSGDYELNGDIPWVTGADQAATIVVGATFEDGNQLLFAIPAERLAGIIDPPLSLAALTGSRTSLIRCDRLRLAPDCELAGPVENVLGKSAGGGLDTSCLAIGLAAAAIEFIRKESESRPDLSATADRFEAVLEDSRDRLHSLAISPDSILTLELRTQCTKLALRATQASLMVAKGVGFVVPHPVQRWVRQATFFLVWSCPRPVAEGVLADLARL